MGTAQRWVAVGLGICAMTLLPVSADFSQNYEHGVYELWDPPYELDGAGITIGLWDGGAPWTSHPEFTGRVIAVESGPGSQDVPTHTAGLLIGVGASPSDPTLSRGTAYRANLKAWNYEDVEFELLQAIADGIPVANHAWGAFIGYWYDYVGSGVFGPGWRNSGNQTLFGAYLTETRTFDGVVYDADVAGSPLVMCFGAGDDRNEGPGNTSHDGVQYPDYPHENPYFDCIDPVSTGKNTLSVGATSDWAGPEEVTEYSAWGPADDGRIKPDLVARGDRVYSSRIWGSVLYGSASGTTRACPVVSGTAALISQAYDRNYGKFPSTAEVKALLLNTTKDKGPAGPDYLYGFGYMQSRAAVDTVVFDGGKRTRVRSDSVADGATVAYDLLVADPEGPVPNDPLRVTLTWIDPPGTLGAPKALINDLDLRLISPTGSTRYPFRLSAADPTALAVADAPNTVDNVEQIVVDAPEIGLWRIEIEGTSVGVGSPQKFAVVSNRDMNEGAPDPAVTFNRNPDGNRVDVTWAAVADPEFVEYRVYRSTNLLESIELIARVPGTVTNFTDESPPPADLVAYDVRTIYNRDGARVQSVRKNARQSLTPVLAAPAFDAVVPDTGSATRLIGRAEPFSEVKIYEGLDAPVQLGTVLTKRNGMFWLDHDFGGVGTIEVFAQADSGYPVAVSVPSVETRFDID